MRLILLFLTVFLASCFSVYKVPVHQGNYVTKEKVSQLSQGMTKAQVKSILGTPLISDVFHENRWDYIYRFDDGKGHLSQYKITVYFTGDSLEKIDGEGAPPEVYLPEENKGFFSTLFQRFK